MSYGVESLHAALKNAVHYNPQTGIFTSAHNEGYCVNGAHDENGQLFIIVNGRKYAAERLAWFLSHGVWAKRKLEHKNGNIADNRLENLVEVRADKSKRKPKISLPEGVHYSASDKKWIAIATQAGNHYYLGRFTTQKSAQKIIDAHKNKKFDNTDPFVSIHKFNNCKTVFENETAIRAHEMAQADKILSSWGAWAHTEIVTPNFSIIAQLMKTNQPRISDSAVIDIVERLYSDGLRGGELFSRVAQTLAALRHRQADSCTDNEGQVIDELLLKTFGHNSPIIKLAIYHYVYGYGINDLALYLQQLVNHDLSLNQCKNRVRWCLALLKSRFYKSYDFYEKNIDIHNGAG